MILAIDAGNSRVKWGWHDGNAWSSIATVSLIEFAASSDHVNPFSVTHEDPERIIISNVAGDGAHQLLVNWTRIFDVEPLWLRAQAEQCGVRNFYERADQLGPDRWAALIAARALHPTGCRHAQAGAVERMYRVLRYVELNPLCIVAGGAGRSLVDQLSMPRRYVENLVLEGLARIAISERALAK